MEEWAKELLGDERNLDITLDEILEGLDNYFQLFIKLRRMDPHIYGYFNTVGTPIITRNGKIWIDSLERATIPNADKLPSMFGSFHVESNEEYRRKILNKEDTCFDFTYFEKITSNYATIAPLGTTIFRHNHISLDRGNTFSKQEKRKYPWVNGIWGAAWLVGVLPDGTVKALPQHLTHSQQLPSGDMIYHSAFEIPPGLCDKELGGDPHTLVRRSFIGMAVLTATLLAGLQVTIRRGGLGIRIGIPIGHAKNFFADRERDGDRRRPILHLRPAHHRHLASGKIVTVGDHLAGQRFFNWRGYEVMVAAPGIHHGTMESFHHSVWTGDEEEAPMPEKTIPIDKAVKKIADTMWWNPPQQARFQRGKLATHHFPKDKLIPLSLPPDSSKNNSK
jgi:hypothetical protein